MHYFVVGTVGFVEPEPETSVRIDYHYQRIVALVRFVVGNDFRFHIIHFIRGKHFRNVRKRFESFLRA